MKKRVSSMQATLMLSLGIVLDLIPALVFVLAFALILPGLIELGSCVESGIWASAKCVWTGGSLFIGGALASTVIMFFVAPAWYAICSIITGILGLVIFTGWFYLLGVPIWGFKKSRILINLFSLLVELLPVISLLPGITFFVWRHIMISRVEDKETALKERVVGMRRASAQAERAGAQEAATASMGLAAARNVRTFPQRPPRGGNVPRYTTPMPLNDSRVSSNVVPLHNKKPNRRTDALPLAA